MTEGRTGFRPTSAAAGGLRGKELGSYPSGAEEHRVSLRGWGALCEGSEGTSLPTAAPTLRAPRAVGMHNLFALQFSPLSGDKLVCTWKWAVTGGRLSC